MIPFTKMHGLGNDYVYLDAVIEPALAERDDLPDLARAISDRRFGIGSDGVIVVSRPSGEAEARGAQVRMRMFNADGSEGRMCGNGIRCVAKLAVERGHDEPDETGGVAIETASGLLRVTIRRDQEGRVDSVTVNMGAPILEPARIPVDLSKLEPQPSEANVSPVQYEAAPRQWLVEGLPAVFVSMGNPHMVSFVDESVDEIDLSRLGPACERHPAFPDRINMHVVNTNSRDRATMRTWERGSGLTLACGTGACAVLVAGALTGVLDRDATLRLPGGDLRIRWDEASEHVFMTGPAREVFRGQWIERM